MGDKIIQGVQIFQVKKEPGLLLGGPFISLHPHLNCIETATCSILKPGGPNISVVHIIYLRHMVVCHAAQEEHMITLFSRIIYT